MKNVDIFIPRPAFTFLLRHSTFDRTVKKGQPKLVIYWKRKNGEKGQSVLSYKDALNFAGMCQFPSATEKADYLGFFLPSILSGHNLPKKNYRFRVA